MAHSFSLNIWMSLQTPLYQGYESLFIVALRVYIQVAKKARGNGLENGRL
ncbi:hypothetical protein [Pseudoramibacter alactolyticus]